MSKSGAHDRVLALVTENIHRARLDREHPIEGDPLTDKSAAAQWLERRVVETELIVDLFKGDEEPLDVFTELIAFAASAIEMWAFHSGHDPLFIMQTIAVGWETDYGEDQHEDTYKERQETVYEKEPVEENETQERITEERDDNEES